MTLTMNTLETAIKTAIAETHVAMETCELGMNESEIKRATHARLHQALIFLRESLEQLNSAQLVEIENLFDVRQ